MKELNKIQLSAMNTGGAFMLIAVIFKLFKPLSITSPIFFLGGAILFGCMQMLQRYEGRNLVIKRLRRIQIFSDLAFILAGFAMLLPFVNQYYGHRNEWLVFFAIGVFLQLYTAFRIPAEIEKEAR